MRRKFTVYGLRFSKTSFWNRINTGFPDPAVATVLTVYGIETTAPTGRVINPIGLLQQYLPFTVLKPHLMIRRFASWHTVATVLTVYGIETAIIVSALDGIAVIVATVLTVYGIETRSTSHKAQYAVRYVATVLTVYGIETNFEFPHPILYSPSCNSTYRLRY